MAISGGNWATFGITFGHTGRDWGEGVRDGGFFVEKVEHLLLRMGEREGGARKTAKQMHVGEQQQQAMKFLNKIICGRWYHLDVGRGEGDVSPFQKTYIRSRLNDDVCRWLDHRNSLLQYRNTHIVAKAQKSLSTCIRLG